MLHNNELYARASAGFADSGSVLYLWPRLHVLQPVCPHVPILPQCARRTRSVIGICVPQGPTAIAAMVARPATVKQPYPVVDETAS